MASNPLRIGIDMSVAALVFAYIEGSRSSNVTHEDDVVGFGMLYCLHGKQAIICTVD